MEKVKLNGTDYPFRFGFYELAEYQEERGVGFEDMAKLGESTNLKDVLVIARLGLNKGLRKSGKGEQFTTEQIGDMADDEPEFITRVMEAFGRDMENFQKGQEKPQKE